MARGPFRQSLAAWFVPALLIWSCSSKLESIADGHAGTGSSGHAGTGGSAGEVGGTAGSHAGDAPNDIAGTAGISLPAGGSGAAGGGSESGGTNQGGSGSGAESGADSAGAAGMAEGGAGGSDETPSEYEGRCDTGWATGSARTPKLNGNVIPKVDGSANWSFTFGRYRLVVAAARGARVIEFSIDGNNLLDASGSTFWPSPQQAYPWPPPAELDSAAYVAALDGASLTLTSKIATTLGLSVTKRFSVNASSGVVSIEYRLINQSAEIASWAPWEVTRVRAGGYTFAPRGPGERTITQDSFQYPLPMSLLPPPPAADTIAWLNYPGLTLTLDNYISEFDGAEGWLAHANRFGKKQIPILFVKSFVDAPDEALPTNEAEIQLWTSGTATPKLIEIEEQGALTELLPGEASSWVAHWSACELPSSALLAAGNVDLAAFARAHAIKP